MSKAPIYFFSEEVKYTVKNKIQIRNWIKDTIAAEGYKLGELNFILCSDEYLLAMNQQFLKHDTYTDVITFDNSEGQNKIVGDIFISIERIQENSTHFKGTVQHELCRVMVHGTLHLLGYKDKGKVAKTLMTEKEDHYLSLLKLSPSAS